MGVLPDGDIQQDANCHGKDDLIRSAKQLSEKGGGIIVETIYDGVNFFTAMIFAVLIWVTFYAAAWYSFFSEARRYSWYGGGLSDFIDLFPKWLVNGILAAWFITGTFPLLNYVADKEQFGSAVGRAREMGLFDERPWYGVGGYQFLAVVLILVASYLIHRHFDE